MQQEGNDLLLGPDLKSLALEVSMFYIFCGPFVSAYPAVNPTVNISRRKRYYLWTGIYQKIAFSGEICENKGSISEIPT